VRSTPLLRSQRFHDWAMTHPVRGSLVVGSVFGAGLILAAGLLGGPGLASVVAPLFLLVGVVLFGPAVVGWYRLLERRSR
jgi:hypothetical protein